jgi:hypothetical protein
VSRAIEPVVAEIVPTQPEPRHAALADVLITTGDVRSGAERCADLFTRYLGLALAVVADRSGDVTVGSRDGTMLTIRCQQPVELSSALLERLARCLYFCWATGAEASWGSSSAGAVAAAIRSPCCTRVSRWDSVVPSYPGTGRTFEFIQPPTEITRS